MRGGRGVGAVAAALVAVALLGASGGATSGDGGVRRFALLIGSNDGGPERVRLRFAVTDARSVAAVLEELGGVSAGDQVLLEEATRAEVLGALRELDGRMGAARRAGQRTELVVYYSGHSDEQGLLLGRERLGYDELRAALAAAPADLRVAILDSCASGALVRDKGGKRVAPFLAEAGAEVRGHAYLTSAAATEAAQESDRLGASFFTHHLVSGLRGAADASGDGRVTLSEAYRFAFDETLLRTQHTRSGPQHPSFDIDLSGRGDVVLTDLARVSSQIVLDEALVGRFFVRDHERRLVAEVHKQAGRATAIGVAPGAYRVAFTEGEAVWSREVQVEGRGRLVLRRGMFERSGAVVAARERGAGGGGRPADEAEARAWEDPTAVAGAGPTIERTVAFRASILPGLSLMGSGEGQRVAGFAYGLLGDSVGEVAGLQLTTLVGIVEGRLEGLQLTAGLNVAGEVREGAQVAAVMNYAGGEVAGAQVAVGVNVAAGGVEGAQVGAVNVAGEVTGAQVGVINIGGRVRGAQIGVVNWATSVEGVSIALLPLVADGYHHVEVWADSAVWANVGLRLGTPALHALLSVGSRELAGRRCVVRAGGGLGSHVALGAWGYLDVDVMVSALSGDGCAVDELGRDEVLGQGRVSLGVPVTSWLALFVGVSANAEFRVTDDPATRPLLGTVGAEASWDAVWFPSLFGGLRLF